MDANLQQFLDEMKNSEETQKKYKDLIEARSARVLLL